MEIWKDIIGYEGLYQASNYGRIKRIRKEYRDNRNRIRIKKEVILSPYKNNRGRLLVALSKNGKSYKFLVNRLIALTFLENPQNLPVVMHIDNNPHNNNVSNLKWGTQKENLYQMTMEGRRRNQFS